VVVGTLTAGWSYAQTKSLIAAAAGSELADRRALNRVYFDPASTADQKVRARQALADLNTATIFGKKIVDGDPLVYACTVRAGDTLFGLSKRSGCPVEIIRQINGMKPSDVLRAGSTIKLLRGPFHARISKSVCAIDVFARSPSGEPTLIHHARVSVGRNNATPEGQFRVAGKAEKATWFPPASMKSTHPAPVKWGEKGYPLGKDGLFMRLTGTEPATANLKGFGIHSTNDQAGIGQARSHGCVRVGDKDVRHIFNLLTDGSDVTIVP